jgi:ElaB/YqjD/DUF883 family membrane-anchored ribosome-binding protein
MNLWKTGKRFSAPTGTLSDAAAIVRKRGRAAIEDTRERVEDWPLASILGAFAVGLLLGALWPRSR